MGYNTGNRNLGNNNIFIGTNCNGTNNNNSILIGNNININDSDHKLLIQSDNLTFLHGTLPHYINGEIQKGELNINGDLNLCYNDSNKHCIKNENDCLVIKSSREKIIIGDIEFFDNTCKCNSIITDFNIINVSEIISKINLNFETNIILKNTNVKFILACLPEISSHNSGETLTIKNNTDIDLNIITYNKTDFIDGNLYTQTGI